jgi:deazaflavin-dependent oxidoreductase (nitroreductase family)
MDFCFEQYEGQAMSQTDIPDEVVDSRRSWVAEHIRIYTDSGGAEGHEWKGTLTLLLTVRGRKSGLWRRTALIYGRAGDGYVVVASNGGDANHPVWFLNLVDHPDVAIQVGPEKLTARARVAEGAERARLWGEMAQIWPVFEKCRTRTEREIPVVVLEPVK